MTKIATVPTSLLTFNEERHEYHYDGELVPSVTQVLGQLYTFAGVPFDVLEAAKERGTAVHVATQFYDEGDLDEEQFARDRPELVGYLNGWKKFLADCQPRWTAIEKPVYHHMMRYAGTPDRWGDVSFAGKRVLDAQVDVKTAETAHPIWGVQTAAYNQAANKPHARRFSLQLNKDGTYKIREWISHEDWPVFVALLTLRRWKERHHL